MFKYEEYETSSKISYKDNPIIDIVNYSVIEKQRIKNKPNEKGLYTYTILFHGDSLIDWMFKTEEERDKVFNRIKELFTSNLDF